MSDQRPDFTTITEFPGGGATAEQLSILCTRYEFATRNCSNRRVLEVGCGAGVGLGCLSGSAALVVGADIDERNCATAAGTYAGAEHLHVTRLDATALPFQDASFDVVLLFEAIYYLPDVPRFFCEAKRVLRPAGLLLISSVNPEWTGFNRSPFSKRYYAACELGKELEAAGFRVRLFAGFPERSDTVARKILGYIRKVGVELHLIPKTMKGKELLKRLFYGSLTKIPHDLRQIQAPIEELVSVRDGSSLALYKMFYAIGSSAGPLFE